MEFYNKPQLTNDYCNVILGEIRDFIYDKHHFQEVVSDDRVTLMI